MKLFVWNDPYDVAYGMSMLVVVAKDLESAKFLAYSGKCYKYCVHDNGTPPPVDLKEPDRIVDLPCAEWHEWSK